MNVDGQYQPASAITVIFLQQELVFF